MRPGGRSARCARRLGSGPGFRFCSGLRFCSHRADGVSHFALNGLGLELLSFAAEFVDHPEESGAPLHARGKPLVALLQAGQLQIAEDGGWTVVVRAERFPLLLVSAAGCGVTAFTFLLIVTGRLAYRGERERGA